MVGRLRPPVPSVVERQIERTVERGGKTYTMNTANIGARPVPAVVTSAPKWRQTDIEDVARYGGVICPAAWRTAQ
jgi:hypothetical protein